MSQSSSTNPNGNGVEGESSKVHVIEISEPDVPVPLNDNSKKEGLNFVLPPMSGDNPNKKTLVLDLDGTLVHTNFTLAAGSYDFTLSLEGVQPMYVSKRPGVDELLQQLGSTGLYEIVIFTAGRESYANGVVDKILDLLPPSQHGITNINIIPRTHRLDRRHCRNVEGVPDHVKDLSILGRDLKNVIIVDDRRSSYYLQPQNAIEIDSWTNNNTDDKSLFRLLSFFLEIQDPRFPYSTIDDVRVVLKLMKPAHVPGDNSKKKGLNCVLPPMSGDNPNKKTLVLDLDGTLVHTKFTPPATGYDFPLSLEDYEPMYVSKRPGVDELLQQLGSTGLYEIVIFTTGLESYANAVIDKILDLLPPSQVQHGITNINIIPRTHRLDRRYCCKVEGVQDAVKDLSILGRDLKNVIIVDDRPASYYLQPQNAIEIDSWTAGNTDDKSLFRLLAFFLQIQDPKFPSTTDDVREVLKLMKPAHVTQPSEISAEAVNEASTRDSTK